MLSCGPSGVSWPPCKGASLRERGDSMWGVLHTPRLSPTPPGLLFPLPCPVPQEVGLCGPHRTERWSSRRQQPEAGGRENSSENSAPTPSSPHPSSVWLLLEFHPPAAPLLQLLLFLQLLAMTFAPAAPQPRVIPVPTEASPSASVSSALLTPLHNLTTELFSAEL